MGRRTVEVNDRVQETPKVQDADQKQLIYMIISLIIAVFVCAQVYFLVLYTLGNDVDMGNLWLYTLVSDILR